jgi:multiple sugar transport system permease protein
LLFTFYPLLASWYISFLDWSGLDQDREFVGFANYAEALEDPAFWDAFGRTFLFAFATVPVVLVLSLLVAIVLNDQSLRLRTVFRTVFFLPVVTTTAIVGIVMSLIVNPFDGPLNAALLDLGLIDAPIDFLGNPGIALWSVAGVYVWKWFGITMIYWLAALQTIPEEVYEAARIDGANAWQLMRRITLPLLKPFLIIITLLSLESALKIFDLMQTMTGGGPFYATEVMEIYIYRWAFTATIPQLGYASAAAVLFGVFVCVVGLLQLLGVRAVQKARPGREVGR